MNRSDLIGVTVARMKRREQFGAKLFDQHALRRRVTDLNARGDATDEALWELVAAGAAT